MRRLWSRLVSLFLIPCLLANPALVHAWDHSPQRLAGLGVFTSQALSADSLVEPNPLIHRLAKTRLIQGANRLLLDVANSPTPIFGGGHGQRELRLVFKNPFRFATRLHGQQ